MSPDEMAAAYASTSDDSETRAQVQQFLEGKSAGLSQLRAGLAESEQLRQRSADLHDQLDSAHWLATQLADLLSREDRRLDHAWRGEVRRALRVLSAHFLAADLEGGE